MKKIQFLATLFSAVLLFSCSPSVTKENEKPANSVDSTEKKEPERVLTVFKTEKPFPFTVDTALLFHLTGYDSLGTSQLKQLTGSWFEHDLIGGTKYDMEQFYKIDSIKAIGKYAQYCDSLDIGNTKCSNAYAICKLVADSNTQIFVWALVTSSYEACPYSMQQTIYFTVYYIGEVTQTFTLGEYGSFGDAPASLERTVSGKMNKDLCFEMNVYEEGDDDQETPDYEVRKEHYEFAIKEGKVNLVKEKKNPVVTLKRKG